MRHRFFMMRSEGEDNTKLANQENELDVIEKGRESLDKKRRRRRSLPGLSGGCYCPDL